MAAKKISGFAPPIALTVGTPNGTEVYPADQTVGGVLGTVSITALKLFGASAVAYTNGLAISATATKAALILAGASGVTTFANGTNLGLRVQGATSTNDYSGVDFGDNTNTLPKARVAAVFGGGGSSLVFGTSNNYSTGITNSALTIDQNGMSTFAAPAAAAATQTITINAASNVSPCQAFVANNDASHDLETVLSTSTAGDAYYRAVCLGGVNWSFGNRRSANAFTISPSVGLGSAVFSITSDGATTQLTGGAASVQTRIVLASLANTPAFMQLGVGGVVNAYIGVAGVANDIMTGTVAGDYGLVNRGAKGLMFGTNNAQRGYIDTNGLWNIVAPGAAGTALTVNARSASRGIQIVGSGAGIGLAITNGTTLGLYLDNTAQGVGTPALRVDISSTTGAGVPTFASNKPTASSATATWLPISLNGSTFYIPCWA